jgi:hypothetical protein
MSLTTILGVVFPLLTIIIGGACVLLFSVTSTLRTSNGDLRARVDDLEKEQVRDKATIATQAAEIHALQKVVTGEVQLAALADVLDHHHQMAVTSAGRLEKSIDAVLDEVRRAS